MQHGTVLGDVDVLTCKQSIAKLEDFGFICEFHEKLVGLVVDEVLGVVEEDSAILAVEFVGELGEAIFVLCKQVLDYN